MFCDVVTTTLSRTVSDSNARNFPTSSFPEVVAGNVSDAVLSKVKKNITNPANVAMQKRVRIENVVLSTDMICNLKLDQYRDGMLSAVLMDLMFN